MFKFLVYEYFSEILLTVVSKITVFEEAFCGVQKDSLGKFRANM